ncbi:hypothetical protein [Varibaculum massiliense]|uniref:hypothetical protein n=1 Tax=Varibaculum massiliense TaxID=1852372 RepID=UPI0008DB1D14|nr:hypothetical protein [Varibaculum massiliense]
MVFPRITYHALSHLNLRPTEIDLMVFGELLDLIEAWRQEQGISRPYRETSIDEIIPAGLG